MGVPRTLGWSGLRTWDRCHISSTFTIRQTPFVATAAPWLHGLLTCFYITSVEWNEEGHFISNCWSPVLPASHFALDYIALISLLPGVQHDSGWNSRTAVIKTSRAGAWHDCGGTRDTHPRKCRARAAERTLWKYCSGVVLVYTTCS